MVSYLINIKIPGLADKNINIFVNLELNSYDEF